jgi:hypothetical protein
VRLCDYSVLLLYKKTKPFDARRITECLFNNFKNTKSFGKFTILA